MRKLVTAFAVTAALVASVTLSSNKVEAGLTHYTLCWTAAWGGSECVHLPRNYRLPGIRKPRIPDGTVSFTLTRRLINCILRNYVSTANMLPGQGATIYAPKY